MASFATSTGTLEIADEMVKAICRHAERQADLTVAYLDATGLFSSEPPRFTAAFLLELGAVLELGYWEQQGLRRHLEVDLPTYREAASTLAARCANGPSEFQGEDAAPLSLRVLHVWLENFSWDGTNLMAADFVVGEVDEDALVDLLANFLWDHRRDLNKLLGAEQ